jgi:tRNA (cytidine/uridine-2'-O-)-methyltransferase
MSLHVVLYCPEIPQNTGNIMRTCAATNATLHLIEPLGFKLDPKSIKRSGVNYLEHVNYHVYPTWDHFLQSNNPQKMVFLTRYGFKTPDQIDMSSIDEELFLVFGKESTGIPKEILRNHLEFCVRLPMSEQVRSLNLANTVCTIVYEAKRQQQYHGLFMHEPESMKGPNWLLEEE